MSLKRFKWLFIVLLIFLGACAPTKISATVIASSTSEGSPTKQSTSTSTPGVPTDTPEVLPTPTKPPIATFTPEPSPTEALMITSTPVVLTPTCTNRATLVRHLSFADGSSIYSGLYFGKSWRIQNTGSCTWTTSYSFVFVSGEQMNAPAETPLASDVLPGNTIDIQILMQAPEVANAYLGSWMLRDPNGTLFGIGEAADQPIVVSIVVKYKNTKDKFPVPECS
jgi:hypothetical protein